MLKNKKWTVIFTITCMIGSGAGLLYGMRICLAPRIENTSLKVLMDLMQTRDNAARNVKRIIFKSVCWNDLDYPQLLIELKTSSTILVVKRPSLKEVERLLEQCVVFGIDFSDEIVIPTAMNQQVNAIDLVKNGQKTEDFKSPPPFVSNSVSPPDYIEHRAKVKSMGK